MKIGKKSKALLTAGEIIVIFVVVFAFLFVLMKTISGGFRKDRNNSGANDVTNTAEPSKAVNPTREVRDLNGLEVTLVTWWDLEWENSQNDYETAYWEMQNEAMKKYNYTLKNTKLMDWALEYPEVFLLGVYENRPVGSIVCMDSRWIGPLMQTGALLDVSNLPSANWSDEKYNQAVIDMMSFNGALYGFASGMEPRSGVFFNKDLFTAAGLSPELPYELQASGQWDFGHFKKLCAQLTRDVNNDGITDIYGVSSDNDTAIGAFLAANGTALILKDGNSGLKLNVDDRRVNEALSFLHDELIEEGYYRVQQDEDSWDYFKDCFANGTVAMLINEQYMGDEYHKIWNPSLDFGFVTMPKGPSADDYTAVCRENVMVLANCDAIRSAADDILFVYDIYTDVPAGMENDDRRWKRSYHLEESFDERAINETCKQIINVWEPYMPYTTYYLNDDALWTYDIGNGSDPDKILNERAAEWSEQIEQFNRNMKEIAK
ncbi:MAG: extracellular solute-binding protein [Lachnospiraceae bacterium]|nr:extracellular solute-binding protein [Lachnospiraceae bacterium]